MHAAHPVTLPPRARIQQDHASSPILKMVSQALSELFKEFQAMFSREDLPRQPGFLLRSCEELSLPLPIY
jgi:hypothetical protein